MKKMLLPALFLLFLSSLSLAQDRLGVAVTIPPLAEFVEQVGGGRVSVMVMIPPGGNPHTYEPTPGQLKELNRSPRYVKVGSGIEFELAWLDKILAINKNLKVCDSSRGIKLINMAEHEHEHDAAGEERHHHGESDPHIWTSLNNAIIMTGNIRNSLVAIDPAGSAVYRKNAAGYIIKLKNLKKRLAKEFQPLRNRNFMAFHPAFAYFALDFGLKEIAVESGGKEPSAKDLARLIGEAKENEIKVVFASPQFSDKSARVIAHEIGGEVVFIDPLARNYLENMGKVGRYWQKILIRGQRIDN